MSMARDGREYRAPAARRVELDRNGLCLSDFMDDDRLARPGVHQAASIVSPRLDFEEVNPSQPRHLGRSVVDMIPT